MKELRIADCGLRIENAAEPEAFNVCDRCGRRAYVDSTKGRTRYYKCEGCSADLGKAYTWKVRFEPAKPLARSGFQFPAG